MTVADRRRTLKVIAPEECLRLLGKEEVGRLAVVRNGYPHILPVNFVLDGNCVVFRTDAGTKLDGVTRGPVAFEIDGFDPQTRYGWSVVVHGRAEEVTHLDSQETVRRVEALRIVPWPSGQKRHLIRIVPRSITGRWI